MPALPESARIAVPAALAGDLLRVAEGLPHYENKDFYALSLQASLREAVRDGAADGYDWLIGEIAQRLGRPPYCALVKGLRYDQDNRLFVAVNRAFGDLVARPYRAPRAQLVHYIQPATDIMTGDRRRTETEHMHTDSADWPQPVRLVSMVCVRPDRHGGGRSLVLEVDSLRQAIEQRLGAETVARLEREPVPWQIADYLGGGVAWHPVLTAATVRWRRYTIDAALADGAELPAATVDTLDAVGALIADTDRTLDFLMAEGELLFMDNHRTLHARTPITGEQQTSSRLMLRSWIQAVDGTPSGESAP